MRDIREAWRSLRATPIVSVWLAGFARSLLFELEPRDPATLAAAVAVLIATGALAAAGPARRAGRTDPAVLLRDN